MNKRVKLLCIEPVKLHRADHIKKEDWGQFFKSLEEGKANHIKKGEKYWGRKVEFRGQFFYEVMGERYFLFRFKQIPAGEPFDLSKWE